MKSTAGFILTLIDGILSFLITAILLLVSLAFFISPELLSIEDMGVSQYFVGSVILILALIFGGIGWAKVYCARLMDNPKTTRRGGIIALIVGIVTFGILSIIGGIFGIVQGGDRKRK